jgi:AmiR/NasT family two-component response regulator
MASMAGAGRKVLVVEDEALVAMLVEDALLDAGFAVIGPAATVEEALVAQVLEDLLVMA